jgi:hypothetical protein
MTNELTEAVRQIDDSFESRFRLISSSYSAASFGDSVALYANKDLEIRLSRDRSEFNCEFRLPIVNQWVSIYRILPATPRSMSSEDESKVLKIVISIIREKAAEITLKVREMVTKQD